MPAWIILLFLGITFKPVSSELQALVDSLFDDVSSAWLPQCMQMAALVAFGSIVNFIGNNCAIGARWYPELGSQRRNCWFHSNIKRTRLRTVDFCGYFRFWGVIRPKWTFFVCIQKAEKIHKVTKFCCEFLKTFSYCFLILDTAISCHVYQKRTYSHFLAGFYVDQLFLSRSLLNGPKAVFNQFWLVSPEKNQKNGFSLVSQTGNDKTFEAIYEPLDFPQKRR